MSDYLPEYYQRRLDRRRPATWLRALARRWARRKDLRAYLSRLAHEETRPGRQLDELVRLRKKVGSLRSELCSFPPHRSRDTFEALVAVNTAYDALSRAILDVERSAGTPDHEEDAPQ